MERLDKRLANTGTWSRKEARELIRAGRVAADGTVCRAPEQKVPETAAVTVDGAPIGGGGPVYLMLNKPAGVVSSTDEPGERTVMDLLGPEWRNRGLFPAGRLDKDSEGLLLLSNDGDLIQAMMKGANRHEKEYLVRVNKEITPEFLEKLAGGVYLEELDITTRECRVEQVNRYTFRMVLTQGVNRQIKRMCRACDYHVRALKRVRVMHVTLGDLKPGEYRELGREDVERLYRDCGL